MVDLYLVMVPAFSIVIISITRYRDIDRGFVERTIAKQKCLFLHGRFGDNPDDAVLLLEKTPFCPSSISDMLQNKVTAKVSMKNDIYKTLELCPGGHISYDIVHERTSRACAAHILQRRRLRLIDVARRAHRPWTGSLCLTFLAVDLSCSALGACGGGDGSCTSGGLNYACRKAHCARRTA